MFRSSTISTLSCLLMALVCLLSSRTAEARTCAEEFRDLKEKTADSRLPMSIGETAKAIDSVDHGENYYISAHGDRVISRPGKNVVEDKWFYQAPPTGRDGDIVDATNQKIKGWKDLADFRRLQVTKAEQKTLENLRARKDVLVGEQLNLYRRLEAKERAFAEARGKFDGQELLKSLTTERELEEGRTLVGPLLVAHTHAMLQRAVAAQKDGKPVRIMFPLPEGIATWQIAIRLLKKGEALGGDNPYAGLSANKNLYLFPSIEKIIELRGKIQREKSSVSPHQPTIDGLTSELRTLHRNTAAMFESGAGGREKVSFKDDKFLMAAVGFGADKPIGKFQGNSTQLIGDLFSNERSPFYAGSRYLGFDLAIYAGKNEMPRGVTSYVDSNSGQGYRAEVSPEGSTTTSREKLNQAILGNKSLSEFIVNRIGEEDGSLFMANSSGKAIDGRTVNEAFTLKTGETLDASTNNLPFAHGVLDAASSADVKKLKTLGKTQETEIKERFFDFLDFNHQPGV